MYCKITKTVAGALCIAGYRSSGSLSYASGMWAGSYYWINGDDWNYLKTDATGTKYGALRPQTRKISLPYGKIKNDIEVTVI